RDGHVTGVQTCALPILVRGEFTSTVGAYVLHVEGPNAGTVSDDHGLSPWSATPIAVGTTTSGTIDHGDDWDYFSFTAGDTATYRSEERRVGKQTHAAVP